MDPEATLNEALKLARSIIADANANDGCEDDHEHYIVEDAPRLAQLVIVLGEWLRKEVRK